MTIEPVKYVGTNGHAVPFIKMGLVTYIRVEDPIRRRTSWRILGDHVAALMSEKFHKTGMRYSYRRRYVTPSFR